MLKIRQYLAWWATVNTTEPVRRLLNQGIAASIAVWLVMSILTLVLLLNELVPPYQIIFAISLPPAFVLAWWLNRHSNKAGAIVLTIVFLAGVVGVIDIRKYLTPWGQPIIIDVSLIFPVIFATFFVDSFSGILVTLIEITMVSVVGLLIGVPLDKAIKFLIFGSLTFLPVTALLVSLAWMYQQALNKAFDTNAQLQARLADYLCELEAERQRRVLQQADRHNQTNAQAPADCSGGAQTAQ